jgi:hypothetical protein
MIVKCIGNDISILSLDATRNRLGRWMDSDGRYSDLEIGQTYTVQALEYLDHGIWFYIHTIDVSEHPYPYASEFFNVEDSSFPINWHTTLHRSNGYETLKRITFREWAVDNSFYERIVEGDAGTVATYLRNRL